MIDGKYETPLEAIGQRLLSDGELKSLVGDRFTPDEPTRGKDQKPYICFWSIGGGGQGDLTGRSSLQNYLVRVELHAENGTQTERLRELVICRLTGSRRKSIDPWIERSKGVQGCMTVDDADGDLDDDGQKIAGQTFSLWFCPQV